MFTTILTWTGILLALGIVLLMALGPAIADLDSSAPRRQAGPAHNPAPAGERALAA